MTPATFFMEVLAAAAEDRAPIIPELDDSRLYELIRFAMSQKLEPALAATQPVLTPLLGYLSELWQAQCRAFAPTAARLAELGGVTLIQSFCRNDSFTPTLPPGIRGDIDVHVAPTDVERFDTILTEMGFAELVYTDSSLQPISPEVRAAVAAKAAHTVYRKAPAVTLLSDVMPPMLPEGFDLGPVYGPVYRIDGKLRLALTIERTISIRGINSDRGTWSELLFQDPNLRIEKLGLLASDDTTFALHALIRVHSGISAGEKRLRPLVELIHLIGRARSDFNADRLSTLAEAAGAASLARTVFGSAAKLSLPVADLLMKRGLDREFNPHWHAALLKSQALASIADNI